MKILLILLAPLFTTGCSENLSPLASRKCTAAQWEKAIKEAKDSIAIDQSGSSERRYSRVYLAYAVERNCDK